MAHQRPNIAVVLAGGIGSRAGLGIPKQFYKIAGKTIIEHTLDAFEQNSDIAKIVIVSNPQWISQIEQIVQKGSFKKTARVLTGGKERIDSSLSAIRAYATADVNLIFHDAVRPLVSQRIISDVCKALETHEAVGVARPAVDTIIETDGIRITAIPERARLRHMQTPQGFRRATIAAAYEQALRDPSFTATDDCGIVVKYLPDIPVVLVDGDASNLKFTYKEDLPVFENLFRLRQSINKD